MEKLAPDTKLLTTHSLAELVYSKRFTPRSNIIFTDDGEPNDIEWTGCTNLDGVMRPITVSSTLKRERFAITNDDDRLVTSITIGDYRLDYHAKLSITEELYEMLVHLKYLSFTLPKREFFSPSRYEVGDDQLVARLGFKRSRQKLISPTTVGHINSYNGSRHGSKGFLEKVNDSDSYDFALWNNQESFDATIGFLASLYQRVADAVNNPT